MPGDVDSLVAHLAAEFTEEQLELSGLFLPGDEGRDGIEDHHVDGIRTHEGFANLEGFLARAPGNDLRAVTADLQQASADWIGSLAYLRAVSERHASQ